MAKETDPTSRDYGLTDRYNKRFGSMSDVYRFVASVKKTKHDGTKEIVGSPTVE